MAKKKRKAATKKKNIKIEEINGFDDLINLYNKIPLLIGMRMHAMIIAFTQGIPVSRFIMAA